MPESLTDEMMKAVQADLRQIAARLDLDQLQEMVTHHFGWQDGAGAGKGVRPLLCLLTCASAGGDWRLAIPAASGIELIHNFSLIHDDIQDGSELRRHRPTMWRIWGEAQAINTGDALFALARLSTSRLTEAGVAPETVLRIHGWIDEACLELAKGQHLDLAFDTTSERVVDHYLRMIEAKTSALLAASAAAGAGIAEAPDAVQRSYRSYGHLIGLAFQITDDVLGVFGLPHETGKPAVDDLVTRKPTYVALYGLQHSPAFSDMWNDPDSSVEQMIHELDRIGAHAAARRLATSKTEQALESLAEAQPMEPAASALRRMAERLLERQS